MKFSTPAIFLLFVLQSNHISAQSGSLDSSFNKNGISINSFVNTTHDSCNGIAILKSGKIILVGGVDTAASFIFPYTHTIETAMIGLTANGIPDLKFANKGKYTFSWGEVYDELKAITPLKSGEFVVANTSWAPIAGGEFDFYFLRYSADGKDEANYVSGLFAGGPRFESIAHGIAVEPNGKIIIAGVVSDSAYNNRNFCMERINANFSYDGTFGKFGYVVTDFNGTNDGAFAIAIMKSGKIVCAGYTYNSQGKALPALIRFDSAKGKIDSSFGTNGKVSVDNGMVGPIYSVKIQSDNKIVAFCSGTGSTFALLRFKNGGLLDNSFGVKGVALSTFTGIPSSMLIQPDGKIVVAGGNGTNFKIARFKMNGRPDSSFGTFGQAVVTSFRGGASSLAIDANGRYVLGGYDYDQNAFVAVRLLSTMSLLKKDFKEEGNSTLIYPSPIKNTATLNYTLPKNEAITILLFDMTGKMIKRFADNVNKSKGINHEELNMESLQAGEYILDVKTPSQNISIKVVKQ